MLQYQQYQVKDFVLDKQFRTWVKHPSLEENILWEQWLSEHPEKQEIVVQAKAIVLSLYQVKHEDDISEQEIQAQIQEVLSQVADLPEEPTRTKEIEFGFLNNFWVKVAATIVLVVGVTGWYFWTNKSVKEPIAIEQKFGSETIEMVEQVNQSPKPLLVNLPDQSTVMLQENGRIRYPKVYADNKREVFLEGGAFFEVTKMTEKPFFVYTAKIVTRVMGTSFRIQANSAAGDFMATVRTGKVFLYKQLASTENLEKIAPDVILMPNQQAIYQPEKKAFLQSTLAQADDQVRSMPSTSFEFKNRPVTEVFTSLEKAYGITIHYQSGLLQNCDLTASLTDEPLIVKLDLICRTIGVNYQIRDNVVTILGKGCLP